MIRGKTLFFRSPGEADRSIAFSAPEPGPEGTYYCEVAAEPLLKRVKVHGASKAQATSLGRTYLESMLTHRGCTLVTAEGRNVEWWMLAPALADPQPSKEVFTRRRDELVYSTSTHSWITYLPIPTSIDDAEVANWLAKLTREDCRRWLDPANRDDLFAEFFPEHVSDRLEAILRSLPPPNYPELRHLRYHHRDPRVRSGLMSALASSEGSLSTLAIAASILELVEAHPILERRLASLSPAELLANREGQLIASSLMRLDRGVSLALSTLVTGRARAEALRLPMGTRGVSPAGTGICAGRRGRGVARGAAREPG